MSRLQFEQQAASGYDQTVGNMTRQLVPVLLKAAHLETGHSVLDVACGTGIAAEAAIAVVGPAGRITASDIAPAMVQLARVRLGTQMNVAFAVEDAQEMTFPDASFDRVICNMSVMYLPDPARGIAEMRRVLRPGGRIAISVNTAPSTALVSRILPIIDRHIPAAAQRSGPNSFDGSEIRLQDLLEVAGFEHVETSPSVPMTVRHRPIGSLPLRAEVTASDGYARIER